MSLMSKTKLATYVILFLGAALRVAVYFQNRSFIIDESNLARNIVEKGFADFFLPLDYEQYSPPLFSIANKLMTLIFGVQEYTLTFISLLAGIGSLIYLYLIAKQLKIQAVIIMYLCLLFSFSELAIRYSTEFKQYALDAFLILAFLQLVLGNKSKGIELRYVVQLSVFGGVAIWASMPLVFLLAAIGLYYLYSYIRNRAFNFSYLVIIGSTWLVSFAIYFFMILKADANSDYLQSYHQNYFFDFIPTSTKSANQSYQLLLNMFRAVSDKTAVSLIGTIAIFIFGCYGMILQYKKEAFLLLMPVVICLFASHLQMYSLLTRLTLFMIPLLLLVFSFGFSELWKRSNTIVKVLLVAFMLLTVINKKGYEYFWDKMEFEDAKTAMNYLETNRLADEMIYVYHSGVPSFAFYNDMSVDAKAFDNYYYASWDQTPGVVLYEGHLLQSGDVFWLYFTHTYPEMQLQGIFNSLIGKATKLDEHRGEQSIVVKYQTE